MNNSYKTFKKYEVKAESLIDFMNTYYKRDRFYGRGKEYAKSLINSYKQELNQNGYVFISQHDNITGEVVSYYKK
ncbi:hypothetical protein [Senegalia massiliensis]|uniref:Uncharacterized protein n=1 Tax=Senegalia massiliensis TaxID=1720316 RepID=A0A845QZ93_9CLOT|nr:hypothetical protein [Senegalia massiliensis]NBI07631.1 hypothetical protein [Senegalia massiliensis]